MNTNSKVNDRELKNDFLINYFLKDLLKMRSDEFQTPKMLKEFLTGFKNALECDYGIGNSHWECNNSGNVEKCCKIFEREKGKLISKRLLRENALQKGIKRMIKNQVKL